jgi:hypothetical protein
MNNNQNEELKREPGIADVAINVVNISIAGGVFLLPAIIAGILGNASIIAYFICSCMFLLVALCCAELGSRRAGKPSLKPPVRTRHQHDKIEITVEDNGNGIPQKVVDKIFQPFFTTKPTGQGTVLGLSLSYDIIKLHGGEIKVYTSAGAFKQMVVQLPIS